MLLRVHIDKIDYDNAAHIPEPELSGNLFGCYLVDFEGIFLLVAGFGPDAAVDVNDIERFRGFYDQICALPHRYHLAERALDLTGDLKVVENGFLAVIELHDFFLLGRNQRHILSRFFKNLLVVDKYVGKLVIEKIPEYRCCLGILRKEQSHSFAFCNPGPRTLPFLYQRAHFRYQNRGFLAFCGGADDCSVVFRENAADQCLQSLFFFLGGYFLRNAHLVCEGEQYNVASCQ